MQSVVYHNIARRLVFISAALWQPRTRARIAPRAPTQTRDKPDWLAFDVFNFANIVRRSREQLDGIHSRVSDAGPRREIAATLPTPPTFIQSIAARSSPHQLQPRLSRTRLVHEVLA
ncbi:unnamed protein product, partial [Iphiclides podalirius]